ncbi:hypothetical protein psal_cds_1216 [Pandoravirus salinus]|uniref:F-box domain containing protein n=1 Tax=Pandoravirus salinus TaxID=1349410 RepID=S4W4A1_9VIRU|nr:hypothetical protein psal_cds_1216 [Pandoravirus salinus]AGO85522.1 hypothetical protein psal_cds_1216 [Pandoravirus salinus]
MGTSGSHRTATGTAPAPDASPQQTDRRATTIPVIAFEALPVDMILETASWCRAAELRALAETCAVVRDALELEAVWHSAYARDWPSHAPTGACLARIDDCALWGENAAMAALHLVKRAPDPRCRHHPPSLVRVHGWRWACASNLRAPLYRCCTSTRVPCVWGHDAVADCSRRPMAIVYRGAPTTRQVRSRSSFPLSQEHRHLASHEAGVAMTTAPASASWHWGTWKSCTGDGVGVCVVHTGSAPGFVFCRPSHGRVAARGPGRLWLADGATVEAT